MLGEELLQGMASVHAGEIFGFLYGFESVNVARQRYIDLIKNTLNFADKPVNCSQTANGNVHEFPEVKGALRVFTAAGRTELGGNHTDHNQGKILAASIQLDTVAVVAERKDKIVIFRSTGYPDVVVDLKNLSVCPEEKGTTEALIRGIANEFVSRGTKVGGWTANASSTVLPGSGLSSSAAVEVLFGKIFDQLYGEGKRSALEIAQIGQKAENIYFGKPSGLMDQTACASGGVVAVDFADIEKPIVKQVQFNPEDFGFALCIVNTHSSHADLTQDYAAIPEEMRAVAGFFGKKNLRSITLDVVLNHAAEIRKSVGDRALLRSIHFFNENRRVDSILSILESFAISNNSQNNLGDTADNQLFQNYLELVNQSGHSSWELLQNVSTMKSPSEQGPASALALTADFLQRSNPPLRGAYRIHGGGFAGTIQVYIPLSSIDR
jgi:galactokinase